MVIMIARKCDDEPAGLTCPWRQMMREWTGQPEKDGSAPTILTRHWKEIELVRITINTTTSVEAIFKDWIGSSTVRIHQEGGKFVVNCDRMMAYVNGALVISTQWQEDGEHLSSVSEFNLWCHLIFDGAVLTQTRVKWLALEDAYWNYVKNNEPGYFAFRREQYRRECEE